jgi:3-dehydroquinate synthase
MKKDKNVKIESLAYPVFIGVEPWHETGKFLGPFLKSGGVYLLTDVNTREFCFPLLENNLPFLAGKPIYSIIPGENSKNLAEWEKILTWLMESGAGRESLLINLGGGVVSDLGGFAAATYKRGMRYINIPTSLIGQADAAVGGKTAINISGVKNQAGLFYDPAAVFINPAFLTTLPENHFRSGFAEIIKCAALSGRNFWQMAKDKLDDPEHLFDFILESVNFKCGIVAVDPYDQSTRKMLNFGHTVGHALESFGKDEMLHGDAVAAGMICEAYLSCETCGLPEKGLNEVSCVISKYFDLKPLDDQFYEEYLKIMDFDKKKTGSATGFSLLEDLGKPSLDRLVSRKNLTRSFEYYNQQIRK